MSQISIATTPSLAASWRARRRRKVLIMAGLAVIAAAAFLTSLLVGPLHLSPAELVAALTDPSAPAQHRAVVRDLRLPPAILATLVGAALSTAGVEMQTILDNPLAEPFTLGVSAAAAFGAAFAIVTGLSFAGVWTLPIAAGAMALSAAAIIAVVAGLKGGSGETMVLLGIALVFGFQALLSLMQYRASTESLQQIVFWTMGSLTRASWPAVITVAVLLAVIWPLLRRLGWSLTALRLGEDHARSFGVRVGRLRVGILLASSLLAAVCVAFVGIIGFIGLVGPHIARTLVGEDQRYLLPAAALAGAALLSSAHSLSLLLVPGVAVPVGIVTAMIGVPVFLSIILGGKRRFFGGQR